MATAVPSTALATIQHVFTDAERLALAGDCGLTREAYALDLRQFTSWCCARSLSLSGGPSRAVLSAGPGRLSCRRPPIGSGRCPARPAR